MHVTPDGILKDWLDRGGCEHLLEGFDVDDQKIAALLIEGRRTHPDYDDATLLAWAQYCEATRNQVSQSARDSMGPATSDLERIARTHELQSKGFTVLRDQVTESIKQHGAAAEKLDERQEEIIAAILDQTAKQDEQAREQEHDIELLRFELKNELRVACGWLARMVMPQRERIALWAWRIAVLLALIALLAKPSHAQRGTSQIDVIKFVDSSSTLIKTFGAPFTVKCSTNLTCTVSGSVLTIVASGGGSGTPGGSSNAVQYNDGASGFAGAALNTTATKEYLQQVSSGAPSFQQVACGDLSNAAASCSTDATNAANIGSGTLPAARLPAPSASTLGGVESYAAVAHQFVNTISTSGVPASAQPACGDLSNAGTGCSGALNPTHLKVSGETGASNTTTGAYCTSGLLVYSFTVVGGTLANGDVLHIRARAAKSGTTDAVRYCLAFGGTACTVAVASATSDPGAILDCYITVVNTTNSEILEGWHYRATSSAPQAYQQTTASLSLASDQVVKVYAYNANSTDTVKGEYLIVERDIGN